MFFGPRGPRSAGVGARRGVARTGARGSSALLASGAHARALTTKLVEADPRLTDRQERILGALCREYIISGRPVASSSLSPST